MPHRNATPESAREVLSTRIRNARAVVVAMMNTFDDDLTVSLLPVAWMHECLEAVKELLDDADDADHRASEEEGMKEAPDPHERPPEVTPDQFEWMKDHGFVPIRDGNGVLYFKSTGPFTPAPTVPTEDAQ